MENNITLNAKKTELISKISKLRSANEDLFNSINGIEDFIDSYNEKKEELMENSILNSKEKKHAIINDIIFFTGSSINIIFSVIISFILSHFSIALFFIPIVTLIFSSVYSLGGSYVFSKFLLKMKLKLLDKKIEPLKRKVHDKNMTMNDNCQIISSLEKELINVNNKLSTFVNNEEIVQNINSQPVISYSSINRDQDIKIRTLKKRS